MHKKKERKCFFLMSSVKAAACITEAGSPEKLKLGVWATEFLLKEPECPESASNHQCFNESCKKTYGTN